MKALLLTNEYPPHIYGGAGVHVDYLSRELAQLIDVEVRCFGEQAIERPHLRVTGYSADAPRFATTDPQLRSPLQALDRCVSFVAQPIQADLVHCHTWYTHFAGIVAKTTYGLPLVLTTHSLEPQRSWKREQLGRGYDLSCRLEKAAMEMADRIIVVSAGMRQDVERLFAVASDRISVVHNGIDTDEYQPVATAESLTRFGIDPSIPYVLFVGRITRQKGVTHLLEAIRHVTSGPQVVLCAGTPDTAEIEDEVRTAVDEARRRGTRVIWIREMVDKRRLIELYSHAAVFCCPSIYEPFGIINLEAMACCTPVVATAVGGIREVVVPEETGLLVNLGQRADGEPTDPEQFARALAAALDRLIRDEALRRRMGAAGRRRAVERFGWDAIARDVVQIYESVRSAR